MTSRAWYAAAALALLVSLGVSLVLTVNGGLQWDDFGNLRFSRETGTLDYVLRPVYDHFAPGHRALSLLQYALDPANTAAMHVVMSGIQVLAIAGFMACAKRLYGARPWIPPLAVLVSLSIPMVATRLWFASSLHQVPALAAALWALYFFLRHRDDAHGRDLLASVALVVIGLTFVSKVLLVIPMIYLVDQLLLRPTDKLRHVVGRTVDEWPLWLAYVLPAALYFVLASELVTPIRETSRASSVAAGVRSAWLERFVPALIGWDPSLLTSEPSVRLALVILLQVAVAALVYIAARRRRDSLRAVSIVVVIVALNGIMTLLLRIDAFGASVSLTYRYWLEPLVLATLLLPWGFVKPPDTQAPRWLQRPPRLVRGAKVGPVFLLAVGALSAVSLAGFVEDDTAYEARAWLDDTRAAVAAADGTPSLVDDLLPPSWAPTWTLRDLAFLLPEARFDDDPEGWLVVQDRLVEPVYVPFFELTGADLPSNTLVRIMGTAEVRDTRLCAVTTTEVDVAVQVVDRRRFARVTLSGAGTASFVPLGDLGSEFPPRMLHDGDTSPSTVLFPADLWPWTTFRILLSPDDGETVCLDALSVGIVENAPPLP